MDSWLLRSLVLSVVLTVVLNAALRLWPRPGSQHRAREERPAGFTNTGRPGVRVIVPWKAMLIASVVGTVLLNVLLNVAVRLR